MTLKDFNVLSACQSFCLYLLTCLERGHFGESWQSKSAAILGEVIKTANTAPLICGSVDEIVTVHAYKQKPLESKIEQ